MEIFNNSSKGGIRPNDGARGVRGPDRGGRRIAPQSSPPAASPESVAKSASQADKIELSPEARALASSNEIPSESVVEFEQERVKFIENIRELLQEGRLNSRERIETAAHKMLGGE